MRFEAASGARRWLRLAQLDSILEEAMLAGARRATFPTRSIFFPFEPVDE